MFYCYILVCSDNSYYAGVSDAPTRRTEERNAGKGCLDNSSSARAPSVD
ncbi:MAG TPA: hypothetical protein VJO16_15765 [Candidatus Acidoferrum sp.]|nr:hypothetical protein [Candidatus Acidoferrum sp.]